MIKNKYVEYYMNQYETGKIKVSKYVVLWFKIIQKHVLNRDDLYFDNKLHEQYIAFTEKHYFKLMPFQKFITAFVFLYHKNGDYPFFPQFFLYKARGAGKNGLISTLANFFISDLHGVDHYNISIVANSEEQAMTSPMEIYNTIDEAGKDSVLQKFFQHKRSEIVSKTGKGTIKYHTSNARTKDSLRDGCVIYDEVHEYENSKIIDVFTSGLGKVKHSREFFITTDGFVRGGYLDSLKERALKILHEEISIDDDPLFIFMATLDNEEEIKDESCWQKANPMFHPPMSEYAQELFRVVKRQYNSLGNSRPSERLNFMTKRMNYPGTDFETSVASWEEIKATSKLFPDLKHKSCVGGLDFASIRDFAAVGLLFKDGDNYIWKSHSFVNKHFLERVNLEPPSEEWAEQGILTIVNEPVINIKHIVDWFVKMREQYGLTTIVADTFRMDIVKQSLEAEGVEVKYVRTKGIEALLPPRGETIFAEERVIVGDNPLMRWYTWNVKVITDAKGNRTYGKKDEIRRKTDGFQAFIHALYRDDLIDEEMDLMVADIEF